MKKLITIVIVASLLVTLTWLWPSSNAAARSVELQGLVMKAHFINVGQANAMLLEFPCGVMLIDAGRKVRSMARRWSGSWIVSSPTGRG